MNKQLYNFTQGIIQKYRQGGQVKNSVLATKLNEDFGFGSVDLSKKHLTFEFLDILNLTKEIQRTLRIDIRNDPYPSKKSRLDNSENNRDEKENSYPVSKDFILINSLSEIKVNQKIYPLSPFTSLGHYIEADEVLSIEHKYIIFVENLAVMANLSKLNLALVSENLIDALWVYRGDIKKQQSTGTAYEFFRRFKKHQRICFSDVDPKGIEIALTSHADYWLTINDISDYEKTTQSLEGNEEEWFKQGASITFLRKKILEQEQSFQNKLTWKSLFTASSKIQKTLKQEHIVRNGLALILLKL